MKNTNISIIIPVFNSEQYLEECLNSIQQQSYPYFKVIIVNDGSSDNSLNIAKRYELTDKRFKVFSKKNEGVSTARNYGIEHSYESDYICFVDSDDKIKKNYLETLLEKKDIDCTIGGILYTNKENSIANIDKQTYNLDTLGNLLSKKLQSMCFLSAWGKLYRLDIIQKYNIRFNTKLKLGEDTLFLHTYLSHCNTFHSTGEIIYIYRIDMFSYKKYQLNCNDTLYAINQIANIYYALCEKFNFQNSSYFLYIIRHFLLAYQEYSKNNSIRYKDVKNLYTNIHVRKMFYARRKFSRFNTIQYYFIKRSLFFPCFILCKFFQKIVI